MNKIDSQVKKELDNMFSFSKKKIDDYKYPEYLFDREIKHNCKKFTKLLNKMSQYAIEKNVKLEAIRVDSDEDRYVQFSFIHNGLYKLFGFTLSEWYRKGPKWPAGKDRTSALLLMCGNSSDIFKWFKWMCDMKGGSDE